VAGANKRRGLFQLRILHVGIRQAAFANVPPFEPFVIGRIAHRRLKEVLRSRVVLVSDDSEVQWLRTDLEIGKQRAGRRKAIDHRLRGQVAHGVFGELLVFGTACVVEEQIRGACDQHAFVALGMRRIAVAGRPRRDKARALWIAEIPSDEANRIFRVSEPFPIAGCASNRARVAMKWMKRTTRLRIAES
jgi:hypothetical protein